MEVRICDPSTYLVPVGQEKLKFKVKIQLDISLKQRKLEQTPRRKRKNNKGQAGRI